MARKNYSYFALAFRTVCLQSQRRNLADFFCALAEQSSGTRVGSQGAHGSAYAQAEKLAASLQCTVVAMQGRAFKAWRHKTGTVLKRVKTGTKGLSNVVAGVLRRGLQRWVVYQRRMQFSELQAALGRAVHVSMSPSSVTHPAVHQPMVSPVAHVHRQDSAVASHTNISEVTATASVDHLSLAPRPDIKDEDLHRLCMCVVRGSLRAALRQWMQAAMFLRTSAQMQERLRLAKVQAARLESELLKDAAYSETRRQEAAEASATRIAQLESQKRGLLQKESQLRQEAAAVVEVAEELRQSRAEQEIKAEELQEANRKRDKEAALLLANLSKSQRQIEEAIALAEFLFDGLAKEIQECCSDPIVELQKTTSSWTVLTRDGATVSGLSSSLRRVLLRSGFYTWLLRTAAAPNVSCHLTSTECISDGKEHSAVKEAFQDLGSFHPAKAELAEAESSMAARVQRAQNEAAELQAQLLAAQASIEERQTELQAELAALQNKAVSVKQTSEAKASSSTTNNPAITAQSGSKSVHVIKREPDTSTDLLLLHKGMSMEAAVNKAVASEEEANSTDTSGAGDDDIEHALRGLQNDAPLESSQPEPSLGSPKLRQSISPKLHHMSATPVASANAEPITGQPIALQSQLRSQINPKVNQTLAQTHPSSAKSQPELSFGQSTSPQMLSKHSTLPKENLERKKQVLEMSTLPEAKQKVGSPQSKKEAADPAKAALFGLDMDDLAVNDEEQSGSTDSSDIMLP